MLSQSSHGADQLTTLSSQYRTPQLQQGRQPAHPHHTTIPQGCPPEQANHLSGAAGLGARQETRRLQLPTLQYVAFMLTNIFKEKVIKFVCITCSESRHNLRGKKTYLEQKHIINLTLLKNVCVLIVYTKKKKKKRKKYIHIQY